MKIGCLHATASLLNFRQRTMSKQFESQIEAVVSPLLQQRHVRCYLVALLSIPIGRRWKLRSDEMPGVTTAVSCKASHGTVASDWIAFSTTCTIWRSLSQLYLLETKLKLHLEIERCEYIFNTWSYVSEWTRMATIYRKNKIFILFRVFLEGFGND
jgi:hypothetical protein